MNELPDAPNRPGLTGRQAGIDADMFEKMPVHIIERFLMSFDDDGGMTFTVDRHILEALAVRFRSFLRPGSELNSLDQAFGGKVGRQRQAILTAKAEYEVAFEIFAERKRLQGMTKKERGNGTPHEMACVSVAKKLGKSVENVRRIYQDSQVKN